MPIEQRHARERSLTESTVILLYEAVGLHVSAQVRAVSECSRADFALERLLARMSPIVALKQPGPREALAAQFALARQSVSFDVHFEGARRHVALVTALAFERERAGRWVYRRRLFT